jgi:hypothetical protein
VPGSRHVFQMELNQARLNDVGHLAGKSSLSHTPIFEFQTEKCVQHTSLGNVTVHQLITFLTIWVCISHSPAQCGVCMAAKKDATGPQMFSSTHRATVHSGGHVRSVAAGVFCFSLIPISNPIIPTISHTV